MLWGAFSNSVTAMQAQSHALQTISTNVSNMNTTGYKRQETLFKTMLSETTPSYDFFGVKTADRRMVDRQGIATGTGVWSDLAINGEGMFVVNSGTGNDGDTFYTRDGGFYPRAASTDGTTYDREYMTTSQGLYLMGYQYDETGTTLGTSLGAIYLEPGSTVDAVPTSSMVVRGNIPSNATTDQTLSLPVYDNDGNVQTLTTSWHPNGAGSWDVAFSLPVSVGTVTGSMAATFDGDGQMTAPTAPTDLAIAWADGTSSTVAFDPTELTQFANDLYLRNVVQDGKPPGEMSGAKFNKDGVLSATYTNGATRNIAKLPVATFVAPNELEAVSGNLFKATQAAGEITVSEINDVPGFTHFITDSVETSNVDIGNEFTLMITTQKAYSSATQVFKAADEMVMTARDLKR